VTVVTDDLARRVLAAVDRVEQGAHEVHRESCWSVSYVGVTQGAACDCGEPDRIRRRCAADRRILEHHKNDHLSCDTCISDVYDDEDSEGNLYTTVFYERFPCPTFRDLAEGYGITVEARHG